MTDPAIDVRRAGQRFHTMLGWLDSWHSFSFSSHYDPDNTHHGLLLVSNDDRVAPGAGFPAHAHRNMEIVTWVLDGRLEHGDTLGNHDEIYPGLAQRMSAGRGIQHSEMNASATEPVHFVQMWVRPDTDDIDASYQQQDVNRQLEGGSLFPIASGSGHDGAVRIHQAGAVLWGGRLTAGVRAEVPDARHVHLFVARGSATVEPDVALDEGDAVRMTDAGSRTLVAGDHDAELLIWATD
jgi:redox-sensitive bicupin YhaK (pirin superfamily)